MSIERRATQHNSTWDKVPTIANSHWAFIGVIAGVAVVVLLILLIAVICCCKRSKNRSRMRHAAQGSDLSAFHPTPVFGQNASGAHRTKFTPLRGPEDNEENDAFVASSPRDSFAYSRPSHKYGHSDADDVRMSDMNSRYYSSAAQSEVDDSRYARSYNYNYSAGDGYGGYGESYGGQQNQFAEPHYATEGAGNPYAPSATPALSSTTYTHAAPSSTYPPSVGQQPYAYDQPSSYPQQYPYGQYAAENETGGQESYQHVQSPTQRTPEPYKSSLPPPPPTQQQRMGGGSTAYAPSVAETAPPPYIPYNPHSGAEATGSSAQQPSSPPPAPRKERTSGGAII